MTVKNIIICSDGTGNTAIKGRGTNVFKLYEAVDLGGHKEQADARKQIAVYDDGVGTESLKLLKILGGALGVGLSRNVRQLYASLCRSYEPGDRIYLFGFSRGAFTVRTLAGLIVDCGIIDAAKWSTDDDLDALVKKAWKAHRRRYRALLGRILLFFLADGERVTKAFRDEYARRHELHPEGRAPVHFIGVWDTVGAVGLPFAELTRFINTFLIRFSFPDLKLSPLVKKAYHALSIDDERQTFHPTLWDERAKGGGSSAGAGAADPERIEQVWFPGVHSNVGGGYPKQGMSLVALDWMMAKAEQGGDGVRFLPDLRARYRTRQNVNDKLYDSRAGLAVYYRFQPRDIARLCANDEVKAKPRVHVSTFERIAQATDGYAPGNLPPDLEVVATPSPLPRHGEDEQSLAELTRWARETLRRPEGLRAARPWILVRRCAHYVLLGVTLVILWLGYRFNSQGVAAAGDNAALAEKAEQALGVLSVWGQFISDWIVAPVLARPALAGVVVALVLSYLVGAYAKSRGHAIYSRFWRQAFRTKAPGAAAQPAAEGGGTALREAS